MSGGAWAAHRCSEAAPGLLHNIGGPPRATISWRGLGRGSIGRLHLSCVLGRVFVPILFDFPSHTKPSLL